MNVAEIILVGAILAVDATVYSFSYGLILRERRCRSALSLAAVVGVFQAAMPLLGYLGGMTVREVFSAWDEWIVLLVFCLLGGSIIRRAWSQEPETVTCPHPLGWVALLFVGFATAVDALAVGVCMAVGEIGGAISGTLPLLLAVTIIGFITFVASLAAFHSARLLHRFPSKWLESLAGLLLIFLGVQHFLRDFV